MLFGFAVVGYLVLGGLGGGLAVVAGCASLRVPREALAAYSSSAYRKILGCPLIVACGALLLGALLLMADSRVEALGYLFFAPKASTLSVGAWCIVLAGALCALLAARWLGVGFLHGVLLTRVLSVLAVVAGLCVATYTGLFLAGMRAIPLWNTPWLPLLFVASSLSCGVTAFVALVYANGLPALFGAYLRRLTCADMFILVAESACAVGLIASAFVGAGSGASDSAGVASALALVFGHDSWAWWLGFVGVGIIAVLACDVLLQRTSFIQGESMRMGVAFSSALCALTGAFALRACLVMAGAHPVVAF